MSRKKKDKSILPWLVAALALILVFVAILSMGVLNNTKFRHFKEDLQADVEYARNGGSVEYAVNGTVQPATFRTPDAILFALSEASAGKRFKGEPAEEKNNLSVDFGNGDHILIQSVSIRDGDGNFSPGILVIYTGSNGKTYAYDTDRITMNKIKLYIDQFEK